MKTSAANLAILYLNQENLSISLRELSLFTNGFAYTAIKQWNELPDAIKSIGAFRVFLKAQVEGVFDHSI